MSWNKRIPLLSKSFNPASSGSQLSPDDIQLVILIDGATNLDGIAVLAGIEVQDLRATFERFAEIGVISWKDVSLEDSRKKYSAEERTTSTGGEPPSIVGSKRLDRSPPPRREPPAPQASTRRPTPPAPAPAAPISSAPRKPADMPPPPPTPVPRSPSDMPPPPPTPMPMSSVGSPLGSLRSATPPPPSTMTPPSSTVTPPAPTSAAPASKGISSFAKWEPKPSSPANVSSPTNDSEEETFESTLTEPPLKPKRPGSSDSSSEEEHTLDPGPHREGQNRNDGEQTLDEQPYTSSSFQAPSRPMPLTSWEKEKLMRERGEAPPEEPTTEDSSSPNNPAPARPRSSRGLPSMPITSWEAKQGRLPSPSQEAMPAAEDGLSKSETELASIVPGQDSTSERTLQDHAQPGKDPNLSESEDEEWDSADDWWALMPEDVGLQRSDYEDLLARRERRLQSKGLGEDEDEGDDGFTPQWREDIFGHLPMFQK